MIFARSSRTGTRATVEATPPEEKLAVAAVNAKDIVEPADLEDRAATCWIKMSDVSIEGLRQAFLDPGSRIRLNPKERKREPEEHTELLSLAWEGGFLDGAEVGFNPNLNVLVGGRGTGKSTIVESIRAVLGLDAGGTESQKAHEGIVRHVLRNRDQGLAARSIASTSDSRVPHRAHDPQSSAS